MDKLTAHDIGKLDLCELTDDEFTKIVDIYNRNKETLNSAQRMNISINMLIHTTSRQYTTPLKEEITKLKQENEEFKEDIKKLKSQNQTLQNSFNQLLSISSQQNPELEDEFQGLLGASGYMSELTSEGKEHTFGN